jgi:hypothetical protein
MQTPIVNTAQVSRGVETDVFKMLHQLWGVIEASKRVPCNHPCSLMRSDLPKLCKSTYWVSPKTDGVRTFLLFSFTDDGEYVAFVDRAGNVACANITAPLDAYSGTLLDGELVTHRDGSQTYIVFDTVAVNGYTMTRKPQSERMVAVVRTVHSLTVANHPKLSVKVKRWFLLDETPLNQVAASAGSTPTDGFIFVPERGRMLRPGPQRDHFKWKPVTHHTIDMVWRDGAVWLEKWGVPEPASVLGIVQVVTGDVHALEGEVVECAMSRLADEWVATFVRVRTDKLHPNDFNVARLTLQNIEENIGLDELQ